MFAHSKIMGEKLTNLRSKTCFQQVNRVSAQKLKKIKALGFCVNFTFVISRTEKHYFSEFLEVLLDSKGACPYMGLLILPITLSFLVQSRIFLYRDAQKMIIYQIGGCGA